MKTITEPARSTPVAAETDVLVVGAGPSGIAAAVAAAREGARVVLVEKQGYVGGNLTIGLPILGFLSRKGAPIIGGVARDLLERLSNLGAASPHQACPLHVSLTIVDPETVKTTALEMLLEAGVSLKLHTTLAGAIVQNANVAGATFVGKGRREAILAKQTIDCTGDADLCADPATGATTEKGDARGGMQPPTLMFRMDNVDVAQLRNAIAADPASYQMDFIPPEYFAQHPRFITVGLRNLIEKARADGLQIPTDRTILITGIRPGEIWVNMTRVKGTDGADAASLTAAEIAARRQIAPIVTYLTTRVPGFQNAFFSHAAPFIGIRESRRVHCRQMLNRDDILACRRFPDAIAVGSYPVDLHHPDNNDCTLEWCADCYDIPYGSLLPLNTGNLLVAGRCAGFTHEAMASTRVMSTCMALGEAAGRAAALSAAADIHPAALDPQLLRARLRAAGAFLR
ncbi:MAG: FAD-dependent oxidoreductase [Opitutaceae bacterium]|jgi:hypothetical protein|nr:FAD-dependent oxidoreductase [Opitutaceae bacterium]